MTSTPAPRPPRAARRLLSVLLHAEDRDAALSDLDEEFEHRFAYGGHRAAADWYRSQVLRSIGPAIRRRWTGRRRGLPLSSELRWAWRGIRGRRFGAVVYSGLVAVAVGGSTLAFSAADAFVFRRAPYPNADRLVLFERTTPVGVLSILEEMEWDELSRRADLFSGLFYHRPSNGPSTVTINGVSTSVWIEEVMPGLFDALGVLPKLGRPVAASDGHPGAEPVALVAWALASRSFGEAPRALGQVIHAEGERLRVVGVMPADFLFPKNKEEIWRPLKAASPPGSRIVVGVLASGMSAAVAQRAIDARVPAATGTRPSPYGPIRVVPMLQASQDPRAVTNSGAFSGATAPALFTILFGAALCLTAVAVLNLVSLELVSALERAHIHAVQTALGATRGVLVRTALVEGLALTSAGTIAGYAAAVWGASTLQATLPRALDTVLLNHIDVDPRAAGFMATITMAAWLVACAPLVWFTSRPGLTDALRRASRASTVSRTHISWRHAIVAVQVTMTVVLLSGATVFLGSYAAGVIANRGFSSAGLATIRINQPPAGSRSREDQDRSREVLRQDVITRVGALSGVVSVSAIGGMPPGVLRATPPSHIWLEAGTAPAGLLHLVPLNGSPEYLDTLGLRLLAGRAFRQGDSPDQVIVDEAFARRFWIGTGALGARYSLGNEDAPGKSTKEIIGIASHLRPGRAWSGKEVFVVHTASPPGPLTFLVRLDAISRLGGVAQAVRAVVPGANVLATSIDEEYADIDGDTRIAASLTSGFAALAFVVAAAGIYGVTTSVVSGRTREIAIRLALGATTPDIRRSILRPTIETVGAGIGAGIAAAVLASRWIESQPLGVTGAGPATHLTVAVAVFAAALLATLRPAWRAGRVNPAIALRAE